MHIDDERIQRFLHGELRPQDRSGVEDHLRSCASCAELVETAREEEADVERLLARLDLPTPAVTADAILDGGPASSDSPSVGTRPAVRWAAGIVLVLTAAGAAWAAPGSPLPGWLDRLVGPGQVAVAPPEHGTAAPDASGVALPLDRSAIVDLVRPPVGLVVTIGIEDGDGIEVSAPVGTASWTSRDSLIEVQAHEPASTVSVRIPPGAVAVTIRVDGITVFAKDGSDVTTDLERAPDGGYRLIVGS